MTDTVVHTASPVPVIGVTKDDAALHPSEPDGITVESFQPPVRREPHG